MTLTAVRDELHTALDALGVANTYRRRLTNYDYPAFIVGWPQSMDVQASMDGVRDLVMDVWVAVEVTDDESSDDRLETLLEAAVTALLDDPQWGVQPATEFSEAAAQDGRIIITCRLPVLVLA